MKILITGANGMLAHALKKTLRKGNKLILTDIYNMDITKPKQVIAFTTKDRPEIIIHTAAYTDVDGAESNKALTLKINQEGTKNVAMAAKKLDIPIVYISTDYVFSGRKNRPYNENDRAHPLSIYGFSKYQAEREVRRTTKKHYICRSAWLYGPNGNNFVMTILRLADELPELRIVNDQRGCPTYTLDLAEGIRKLIKTDKFGTYHLTNAGSCSWYQLAKEIIKIKKLNNKIKAINSNELGRPAKRPVYSVLSKKKINNLRIVMRPWQKALRAFLRKLKAL